MVYILKKVDLGCATLATKSKCTHARQTYKQTASWTTCTHCTRQVLLARHSLNKNNALEVIPLAFRIPPPQKRHSSNIHIHVWMQRIVP